ncbi:hypothetical protein [Sphingosinicella sp.]|uniref:hypothetical protein n=1 Tax=Sphingosinicella sp. TaxID=1917971 RepID=UPI0017BBB91E|nr:hypothetical protein [Sphingosinicella sp.]MBA4758854.1 hypothetical protein [Sphingosinicella sp.]
MKLTKRPVVRCTSPTDYDAYMPGFRAQALVVQALNVEPSEAARLLMAEAESGRLPARCHRRADEFTSTSRSPTIRVKLLRPRHEQCPAVVHPEDWAAIRHLIVELEEEIAADGEDACTPSVLRLVTLCDFERWSFRFRSRDALGNSQFTTLEDVDFRRAEVTALCAPQKDGARRGRPTRYDWPAFFNEATRLLKERGGLNETWIKADLERDMEFWCETTWHRTPSANSIANHVRKALITFDNTDQ